MYLIKQLLKIGNFHKGHDPEYSSLELEGVYYRASNTHLDGDGALFYEAWWINTQVSYQVGVVTNQYQNEQAL
jgi:hypothetical protein